MARILHLLACMCVLNMCLSQIPPYPPHWGWGRQYDTYHSWQVTATAYKYPLLPQQLPSAAFSLVAENQNNGRTGTNCGRVNTRSPEVNHDSKMNERSIALSSSPKLEEEVRVHTRIIEPVGTRSDNGSSKILHSFPKPGRRRGDSNQITFPGPTAMPISRTSFVPVIPESCQSSTFCENVPNYPQEEIDRLLTQVGKRVSLSIDQLDTPEITQRLGPEQDNVSLCGYTETVVYPQSVKGVDGKWYTLVNNKKNPVQGFRVEICKNAGSKCSDIIAAFQENYTASCQQKYVIRTATVITDDGSPTISETRIKLPSCCSCVAKYNLV